MENNEEIIIGDNEINSQLTGLNKGNATKKTKILLFTGISTLLLILIIIIIIIVVKNINNNKKNEYDKIAEINCIYNIQNKKETIILGNEFVKNSEFDIYINGQKIKYSKKYQFSSIGINKVQYIIYEELGMDFMFKEVSEIINVEMISKKNCKITSMESMFEGAQNLEKIIIKGFDTSKVKSMKKLFYKTSLSEIDISDINTENIKDMSYMFAFTKIEKLNLSNFNTSQIEDMSFMFQECNTLLEIDISNFNT